MTELLIEHLQAVSTAQDGVRTIRELILQLAVRGKLVPQDPNDEPATALLKKITQEYDQLSTDGHIRKEKALPPIQLGDKPFSIPSNWTHVRLGQLGNWGAGATPLRSNTDYYNGPIPWFKSGELVSDVIFTSEETVTEAAMQRCSLSRMLKN